MSRVGNKHIVVPADVTVTIQPNNFIVVKGQKGELLF
jgi:large subunit ribosomal protein L6